MIFYAEGVKETNWSATAPVVGTDGVERRWVYLHYFKEGQPSINWLDPSFAGMRLVIGDVLHSLADLGSSALRLDANGFLGVERSADGMPAWSEGHPLSEAANHLIASMVRKVGGFTFQELNLTIDDIRATGEAGADLSYDFVTRPAYQHALATGDTEFLRLCLRTCLDVGVDPASLVHAMQNHDELTYELLHWSNGHRDDLFPYHGERDHGRRPRRRRAPGHVPPPHRRRRPLQPRVHHERHRLHHRHGHRRLAGHHRPRPRSTRPPPPGSARAHLLLAMYNALQPGVFALSGWDLCGMLTLPPDEVADLLVSGDTRWINRPAHDLMGVNPRATKLRGRACRAAPASTARCPSSSTTTTSFARQLQAILAVRERYGIAVSRQIDIPDVSHRGMLVMVHQLAEPDQLQLTVLNFANEPIAGTVRSEHLMPGSAVSTCSTTATWRPWTTCRASTSSSPARWHGPAGAARGRAPLTASQTSDALRRSGELCYTLRTLRRHRRLPATSAPAVLDGAQPPSATVPP